MTRFFKVSGAGNDFIALAEPETRPTAERVRAWCTRGLSAGADGLFVLERIADGVRMRYANADGRPAALCLNGTRCAAQLAVHLGWTGRELIVKTDAGAVPALALDRTTVAVDLGPPEHSPEELSVEVDGRPISGWRVTVGVPHFVVFVGSDLDGPRFRTESPSLRSHARFGEAGANVDYAIVENPHRVRLRTWERGVEGETLACGTGALATVAAGVAAGGLALPVVVDTAGGFELEVGPPREIPRHWSLAGDARVLLEGRLMPEAECFPRPSTAAD